MQQIHNLRKNLKSINLYLKYETEEKLTQLNKMRKG